MPELGHPPTNPAGTPNQRRPAKIGDLAAPDNGAGPRGTSAGAASAGSAYHLLSLSSVIVLLGSAAAGTFIYANHEVGSIPCIPVRLFVKDGSSDSMTILLTNTDGAVAVDLVQQTAVKAVTG
jgi:hypothetical protein